MDAEEQLRELVESMRLIESLEIGKTRSASSEFAVKRLSEACAIARTAIAKAEKLK